MKKIELSLIIPAYDEEKNMGKALAKVVDTFRNQRIEVNVIDDGSTDSTAKIVREFMKKYSFIKLYQHERNLGYADAINTGFRHSKGKFVSFIDADLQNNPEDILKLLPYCKKYDVIVGWRKNRKDKMYRLVISKIWNILFRTVFNLNLVDINGKPKIFKSEIVKKIDIETKQWSIDLELLHKAKRMGYRIIQVPVEHSMRETEQSKANLMKGVLTIFHLFKYRINSL